MGHTRLGLLPQTKKWRDVVELIAVGADVPQVADATVRAAEAAFSFVGNDRGYNHAVWLLAQLGLASSKAQPLEYLRSLGIDIPVETTLPAIAVALTESLDAHCESHGGHSDLGELAQRALMDAVVQRLSPALSQQAMFGLESEHMQQALLGLGKQREFGRLMRDFFCRLTNECLNYFLTKTLATHLGEGQRFTTTTQLNHFDEAMDVHCREASAIVEQFSEEWFSKHRYIEKANIANESIQGFASYALKKMKDELNARAQAG